METNQKFIQMLKARQLDVRPDLKRNKDIAHVAQVLGVSPIAVVNWLAPPSWKTLRRMKPVYLSLLEVLAGQESR